MKVIAFDIEILRPNCVVSMSPLHQYIARVFTALAVLAIFFIIHCLVVILRHKGKFHARMPSLICVVGMTLFVFNVSIVSTMVVPFLTHLHPNGRQTIQRFPSVIAFEGGDHSKMIAVGAVFLTILVGYLVVCT